LKVLQQHDIIVKQLETTSATPVGNSAEALRKPIGDRVDCGRGEIGDGKPTFE